jgi:DNA-binding GntR family transcriptional regulator
MDERKAARGEVPERFDPKGSTRAEEVRLAIEADIFQGRLRPGSRLDEESLAQRFNISRTPIREAILLLVHSGLVEKRPRQGAVVAPLQLHRMVQLFEVMSEIEGMCSRLAARRMTPAEKEELTVIQDSSRVHMEAHEIDQYYAWNRRFHEVVQIGCHNEPLQDIAHSLWLRLGPYRRYQLFHPTRMLDSFNEHGAILDAILACDPERAYQAMRRHVTIQIDALAEFVSIMGGPDIQ